MRKSFLEYFRYWETMTRERRNACETEYSGRPRVCRHERTRAGNLGKGADLERVGVRRWMGGGGGWAHGEGPESEIELWTPSVISLSLHLSLAVSLSRLLHCCPSRTSSLSLVVQEPNRRLDVLWRISKAWVKIHPTIKECKERKIYFQTHFAFWLN